METHINCHGDQVFFFLRRARQGGSCLHSGEKYNKRRTRIQLKFFDLQQQKTARVSTRWITLVSSQKASVLGWLQSRAGEEEAPTTSSSFTIHATPQTSIST